MKRLQGILRSRFERLWKGAGKNAVPDAPRPGPHVTATAAADTAQPELEKALAFLQQGNLDAAESIYRSLLQLQSDQSEALHFLGVVQAQRQNFAEAAALISRSIDIDPGNPAAHLNHGNVLRALQRNEQALASYDKALALDPDSAVALNNRGAVLGELGRHDEALTSYERARVIDPGYVDAMFNRGNLLVALKRHQEALAEFDRTLAINPDHLAALLSRGLMLALSTRNEEALAALDRVLRIKPDHVEAHANRGSVLAALDRREEALASYDRALRIHPGYAEALFNRGNVLASLARHEEALASYDGALAIKPDYRDALIKRCATLAVLKRFDEALAGYRQALALNPDDIEALFNSGIVLVELKRYAEAADRYDKALAIQPDFVEVHNNRGIALWHAGQYDDAVASYDRALALRPDYADAFFNRGVALTRLNRKAEALASYDRAVVFDPRNAGALNNRGMLLADMKRYDDALSSFDRALAITPDSTDTLANRGGVFRALGLFERAAQDFSRLLALDVEYEYALGNKFNSDMHTCNWKQYHAVREQLAEAVRAGKRASFPFSFLVMSDSGAEQLQCARTYALHKFPLSAKPLWAGERYRHRKIRIAYLSADFHGHATAYLMVELFEKHDREKFEVSAWSFGPKANDDMRKRLQQSFDQFNDVQHLADAEVAAMLRAQEIDIAIDLKGYTRDSRSGIFSHRAVPIQVNYLVYPGTMGADYMDYIIGDAEVIPPGHESFYAEKVVRLPDSYQVNDSKRAISERTPSRADSKLPESDFVFCCFNKNYKIVPEVFDIWMRLLKQVEGSVLWLFEDSAAATRNLRSEAESRGVRADRLVFAAHAPLTDHLARHRLADLFLDTLPCNAHTTASDALWAGLPVLTCRGNAFPGRVAASLLRAIGLPELITDNPADYEALALKLATTPDVMADIRSRLARNRNAHPLFDIDRCRRHVESAYITMYERYQRGEPPQDFSVQPIS